MSCPTCGLEMECIYDDDYLGCRVDQCVRCGTSKVTGYEIETTVVVPKLVERCRNYRSKCVTVHDANAWNKYGIAESINLPGDRPQ